MELSFLILLICSFFSLSHSQKYYNAIFSFGDSITDTGNMCTGGCPSWLTTGQPPYGETFFGKPTGRCTDGRVIIDYMAEYFGLPLLPPSKSSGSSFQKGANMAIIGATTLNADFFQSIGLSDKIWNNGPLDTQIQWFQQILPSVCASDCKSYLSKSLFIMGEFGGNDYNAPLFSGSSTDTVSTYVPNVIQKISDGIEKLIALGAVDIVVPGVLPIGCFPLYLTLFQSSNTGNYDQNGCLKNFNSLSAYHNSLLTQKISTLRTKYPGARIMYADFYNQVYQMVQSPQSFGLKYGLKVCCGASGQGQYNYNNNARCGMSGSSPCPDPHNYLIWDGIHLTEAAYQSIANGWLKGPYCSPAILG
ncbi:GDSL esterase/lipase [Carex littledalei]|uniref:GDSL esterase/lipase n=1 Tax=Carex littledalei TaxID=544730 RepID=A0A833VME9_9POAL|nr:GDSL esterase/lipase [Carex littledalei]